LLPREILTQRMIRAKKPWAIAGVAAMVLACALNYAFWYNRWWEVNVDRDIAGVKWKDAIISAEQVSSHSSTLISSDKTKTDELDRMRKIGQEVVGTADRRVLWLEVMKALNKSLPPMKEGLDPKMPTPDFKVLPFEQRKDLKIQYVETEYFQDLATWFTETVKEKYIQLNPELLQGAPADGSAPADAGAVAATPQPDASGAMPAPSDGAMTSGMAGDGSGMVETGPQSNLAGIAVQGPTGPGWVVEIFGHHFYNDPKAHRQDIGSGHVEKTLLKELKDGFVLVPVGPGRPPERFTMKELGIGYAILAYSSRPRPHEFQNPNYTPPANTGIGAPGAGGLGGAGLGGGYGATPAAGASGIPGTEPIDPNNPPYFRTSRYDFAIQFVWKEMPIKLRLEERKKAQDAAKAKAEADSAAAGGAVPADGAAAGAPAPGAPAPGPVAPMPVVPPTVPAVESAPAGVSPANPTDGPAALPAGPGSVAPALDGGVAPPVVPPSNPDAP
jgi:type IV pilus assembly protein PilM